MIHNLTGENLRLYGPDTPDVVEDTNEHLLVTLAPTNTPVRVAFTDLGDIGEAIAPGEVAVPLALIEYSHLDGLPDKRNDVLLIVSLSVAVLARGRSDLLIARREVRTTTGAIAGYRQLASPC